MHVSNLQQAPNYALTSDFKLLNQMVFSWYGFAFPCVLTALQISLTLALMLVLRATTGTRLLDFDPLPRWGTLKKVLPLTVTWWVYVVSGLIALRHLSVPMFSVFRRVTTLLVMVGECRSNEMIRCGRPSSPRFAFRRCGTKTPSKSSMSVQ